MPQQTYYTTWTKTGLEAQNDAIANQTVLTFAALVVGDGAGAPIVVDPSATSLKNQLASFPFKQYGSVIKDPINKSQLICEITIPNTIGGWVIREIGIVDADGKLLVYGNTPDQLKSTIDQGASDPLPIRISLVSNAAAQVQIVNDSTDVYATQHFVNEAIAAHEAEDNPHPQYLSKADVAPLTKAINDAVALSADISALQQQQTNDIATAKNNAAAAKSEADQLVGTVATLQTATTNLQAEIDTINTGAAAANLHSFGDVGNVLNVLSNKIAAGTGGGSSTGQATSVVEREWYDLTKDSQTNNFYLIDDPYGEAEVMITFTPGPLASEIPDQQKIIYNPPGGRNYPNASKYNGQGWQLPINISNSNDTQTFTFTVPAGGVIQVQDYTHYGNILKWEELHTYEWAVQNGFIGNDTNGNGGNGGNGNNGTGGGSTILPVQFLSNYQTPLPSASAWANLNAGYVPLHACLVASLSEGPGFYNFISQRKPDQIIGTPAYQMTTGDTLFDGASGLVYNSMLAFSTGNAQLNGDFDLMFQINCNGAWANTKVGAALLFAGQTDAVGVDLLNNSVYTATWAIVKGKNGNLFFVGYDTHSSKKILLDLNIVPDDHADDAVRIVSSNGTLTAYLNDTPMASYGNQVWWVNANYGVWIGINPYNSLGFAGRMWNVMVAGTNPNAPNNNFPVSTAMQLPSSDSVSTPTDPLHYLTITELNFQNNLLDSSPAAPAYVPHGNVVLDPTFGDGSILLDGSGWIDCGAPLQQLGDLTFTARVRKATDTHMALLHLLINTGGQPQQGFHVHLNADGSIAVDDGLTATVTSSTGLVLSNQEHVIEVDYVDDTQTFYVFVDGKLVNTHLFPVKLSTLSMNVFTIGRYAQYSNQVPNFNGNITNVQITNGACRHRASYVLDKPVYSGGESASGDQYWDKTVLLMHFEGLSGGSNYKDERGHGVNAIGNVDFNTATPLYGTSSAKFSGGLLQIANSSAPDFAFGTMDFTVELAWIPDVVDSGKYILIDWRDGSYSTSSPGLAVVGANLAVWVGGGWAIQGPHGMVAGQRNNICFQRINDQLYLIVNGVIIATVPYAAAMTCELFTIGGDNSDGSGRISGLMDELRITKGVGRYPTNYTPMQLPFSNDARYGRTDPHWPNVVLQLHAETAQWDMVEDVSSWKHPFTSDGVYVSNQWSSGGTRSLIFNGNGSANTPWSPEFSLGTRWTLEYDIYSKIDNDIGKMGCGQYQNSVGQAAWDGLQFAIRGSRVYFWATNNSNEMFLDLTGIKGGLPHHVAVVRQDAWGGVFIDGNLIASRNDLPLTPIAATRPFVIGKWDCDIAPEYMTGYIDNLRLTAGIARHTDNYVPYGIHADTDAESVDPYWHRVALLVPMNSSNTGSAIDDARGNLFTATGTVNIVSDSDAVGGSALQMVQGAFVSAPYSSDWVLAGDFTIEGRFKISQHDNYGGLICCAGSGSGWHGWQLIFDGTTNVLRFEYGYVFGAQDTTNALVAPGPISLNQYVDICIQRRNGVMVLMTGGNLMASVNYAGVLDSGGAPLKIGQERTGLGGAVGSYNNIRITNGAARYSLSAYYPSKNPYYDSNGVDPLWNSVAILARAQNSQIVDVSRYGNIPTATNQAVANSTGGAFGDGVISVAGQSIHFRGSQNYCFGQGDFTVETFVKMNSTVGPNRFTDRYPNGAAGGTWCLATSMTGMSFTEVIDGEPGVGATVDLTNTLVHIAAVRYKGTLMLFANGKLMAQRAGYTNNFNNYTYDLILGINDSGLMQGQFDEFRVSNGVARYTEDFIPLRRRFMTDVPPPKTVIVPVVQSPQRYQIELDMWNDYNDFVSNFTLWSDNSSTPKPLFTNDPQFARGMSVDRRNVVSFFTQPPVIGTEVVADSDGWPHALSYGNGLPLYPGRPATTPGALVLDTNAPGTWTPVSYEAAGGLLPNCDMSVTFEIMPLFDNWAQDNFATSPYGFGVGFSQGYNSQGHQGFSNFYAFICNKDGYSVYTGVDSGYDGTMTPISKGNSGPQWQVGQPIVMRIDRSKDGKWWWWANGQLICYFIDTTMTTLLRPAIFGSAAHVEWHHLDWIQGSFSNITEGVVFSEAVGTKLVNPSTKNQQVGTLHLNGGIGYDTSDSWDRGAPLIAGGQRQDGNGTAASLALPGNVYIDGFPTTTNGPVEFGLAPIDDPTAFNSIVGDYHAGNPVPRGQDFTLEINFELNSLQNADGSVPILLSSSTEAWDPTNSLFSNTRLAASRMVLYVAPDGMMHWKTPLWDINVGQVVVGAKNTVYLTRQRQIYTGVLNNYVNQGMARDTITDPSGNAQVAAQFFTQRLALGGKIFNSQSAHDESFWPGRIYGVRYAIGAVRPIPSSFYGLLSCQFPTS